MLAVWFLLNMSVEGSLSRLQVIIEVGPASESIAKLAAEGVRWDLAFLDADKGGYLGYYKQVCLTASPHAYSAVNGFLLLPKRKTSTSTMYRIVLFMFVMMQQLILLLWCSSWTRI